jgi:hypothetical protein
MPSLPRTVLLSACLSVVSLLAGAAALVLAEFGAPAWIFVVLLAWLVTFGLPTLVSVLLLATFWPGPSFLAFVMSAGLLSFLFQFVAVSGVRRLRARRLAA